MINKIETISKYTRLSRVYVELDPRLLLNAELTQSPTLIVHNIKLKIQILIFE